MEKDWEKAKGSKEIATTAVDMGILPNTAKQKGKEIKEEKGKERAREIISAKDGKEKARETIKEKEKEKVSKEIATDAANLGILRENAEQEILTPHGRRNRRNRKMKEEQCQRRQWKRHQWLGDQWKSGG